MKTVNWGCTCETIPVQKQPRQVDHLPDLRRQRACTDPPEKARRCVNTASSRAQSSNYCRTHLTDHSLASRSCKEQSVSPTESECGLQSARQPRWKMGQRSPTRQGGTSWSAAGTILRTREVVAVGVKIRACGQLSDFSWDGAYTKHKTEPTRVVAQHRLL